MIFILFNFYICTYSLPPSVFFWPSGGVSSFFFFRIAWEDSCSRLSFLTGWGLGRGIDKALDVFTYRSNIPPPPRCAPLKPGTRVLGGQCLALPRVPLATACFSSRGVRAARGQQGPGGGFMFKFDVAIIILQ